MVIITDGYYNLQCLLLKVNLGNQYKWPLLLTGPYIRVHFMWSVEYVLPKSVQRHETLSICTHV